MGSSLGDLHFVIMGVGNLGRALGQRLIQDGARITITDKEYDRMDQFMASLAPADRTKTGIIAPYQVLEVACDILVPCAFGGIFNESNAGRLFCRSICGGANNQLAGHSLEEDLAIARALHRAGILFVPDWLAGAGGTIHGTMEFREGETFDAKKVQARIHRICGEQIDELLDHAKRTGRPPLELAFEDILKRTPGKGASG
jgi:leucine dehydrogenase